MRQLAQSVGRSVMVWMADSTDHITGKTGLTLTITASKDGAAFASITPTAVNDRGSGWYEVQLTSTHTNTVGDLALHITSTGADATDVVMQVRGDASFFTAAGIANAVWDEASASHTTPNTMGEIRQLLPSTLTVGGKMRCSVDEWLSTAAATPTVAGVPEVDVTHWLGTAVQAGATAGIPLVEVGYWDNEAIAATSQPGVPVVDVTHWRGTAAAAPTVAGIPKVEVSSLTTAALESIRDKTLDYAYRSGRTVRGLFRRLGAALEKATGLKGSTVTYFQPDGTTPEFSITQDVANGTRTNPVVTNSEVP